MLKGCRVFFTALLVLALSSCAITACSESAPAQPGIAGRSADNRFSEIKPLLAFSAGGRAPDLSTEDVVTVHTDGTISVFSHEVTMTILPPFGWIVLTQDILAQLDTYVRITDDIEALQAQLKAMGAQAYCFDPVSDSTAVFRIGQNDLSRLLGNIRQVPETDLLRVRDQLQEAYRAESASVIEAGGNQYIKLTGRTEGKEFMILITYVNRREVTITCNSDGSTFSDFELAALDALIADLVLL